MYILIFVFVVSRWEEGDLGLRGSKHSPNLICYEFVNEILISYPRFRIYDLCDIF
jgi:hypothetical protein